MSDTLTLAPLQETHSENATTPPSACRDQCPLCDGPINRMHKSTPRFNKLRRQWSLVAVIKCEHCNAASFAQFRCSPDAQTIGRPLGGTGGLLRCPERIAQFLIAYPELAEVFEG